MTTMREAAMPQEKTGAFSGHGTGNRAEHGTYSGYQMHVLYHVPFPEDSGGEPCGCRQANADYKRANRYAGLGVPATPPRKAAYAPRKTGAGVTPVVFRPAPDPEPGPEPGP